MIPEFIRSNKLNMHAFTLDGVEYEFTRGRYFQKKAFVLGEGMAFGELALLQKCKRTATIKQEDTYLELASLSKEAFNSSLNKIEEIFLNQKIAFLRNLHSFRGLTRK